MEVFFPDPKLKISRPHNFLQLYNHFKSKAQSRFKNQNILSHIIINTLNLTQNRIISPPAGRADKPWRGGVVDFFSLSLILFPQYVNLDFPLYSSGIEKKKGEQVRNRLTRTGTLTSELCGIWICGLIKGDCIMGHFCLLRNPTLSSQGDMTKSFIMRNSYSSI